VHWIYLSPHLDDAVFSCGGLIWEQKARGEHVEIMTIFAGDPPPGPLSPVAREHHRRWGTSDDAPRIRREEDACATQRLGVVARQWDYADAIYRRLPDSTPLIRDVEDLTEPLPAEPDLLRQLEVQMRAELPAEAEWVVPLGAGDHVDHRLVRLAAESLGHSLYYYADFPYAGERPGVLKDAVQPAWRGYVLAVSREGLSAWQKAMGCYRSQLSTFWPRGEAQMRAEVMDYWRRGGGSRLWLHMI
jgi:LmbE family N-acetylglucosaminyl deacetylase